MFTTPKPNLFGQPAAQPTTQPALGGLFGQPQPAAPAPTNLFGATPTPTAPTLGFGQKAPATVAATPMFGASSVQPTPQPISLFGSTAPAPSLFGQPAAKPAVQPAGLNLFGQAAAPAVQPTTAPVNLFGAKPAVAPQPAPSMFGAPTPVAPVVQSQPIVITQATKYFELDQQTKQELDNIERSIQAQIYQCASLNARNLTEPIKELEQETATMKRKLLELQNLLHKDQFIINGVKAISAKELRHSELVSCD